MTAKIEFKLPNAHLMQFLVGKIYQRFNYLIFMEGYA
jgi:hypothetical protein